MHMSRDPDPRSTYVWVDMLCRKHANDQGGFNFSKSSLRLIKCVAACSPNEHAPPVYTSCMPHHRSTADPSPGGPGDENRHSRRLWADPPVPGRRWPRPVSAVDPVRGVVYRQPEGRAQPAGHVRRGHHGWARAGGAAAGEWSRL